MTMSVSKDNVTDGNQDKAPEALRRSTGENTYDKEYYESCRQMAQLKAKEIGANTIVNYVPHQNVLVLRGESMISKSDLLKPNIKDVFESAVGFKLTVMGYGPHVKSISIGDMVDIKNTSMMSLCRFVPDDNNIAVWVNKLKGDRNALIANVVKGSENPAEAGRVLKITDTPKETGNMAINLEEEVLIVEHFVTEDHNISGAFFAIDKE